jgi:hypothetical protein
MPRKELLKDKDKTKFIELLILVGSILTVLNPPPEMIYLLLLAILISLFLYVGLKAGIKKIFWYNVNVAFLSAFLSGVFTFHISMSVVKIGVFNGYYLFGFVLLFYGVLSYLFYITLNKPIQRGRQSMWKKIKNYICTIIGLIAFVISSIIFWYTYNLFLSNNGRIEWSNILAIGLSSLSIGIALISMCISLIGGRRIRRLIDSDYENFMNLFENVRIDFIEEAAKRQGVIERVNVEVLAWKSRQYFDRAINLREWVIDESKLRHLSEYTKQLVILLFAQRRDLVWNRDVGNIVKMYRRLWETGVINYAEDRIKTELLLLFDEIIGTRRPDENDLALFNRILTTISPNPDVTFGKIGT